MTTAETHIRAFDSTLQTTHRWLQELELGLQELELEGELDAEQVATFSWIPGVAWSDHLAFWRQGYRALMVTDTDLPDELDYASMAAVTEGVAHAVTTLARDD